MESENPINKNAATVEALKKVETKTNNRFVFLKKWNPYFFEFFMLFLAVLAGFYMENLREQRTEQIRLKTYLKSMLIDIESNITSLDSAIHENSSMITRYDTFAKQLLSAGDTINRAEFASNMGVVWLRGFINNNETFEQMKSSGSLRYIEDFNLLTAILDYERRTEFAQWRTSQFEQKYYTDIFLPALYQNYDLQCMFYLDTAYTNNIAFMQQLDNHVDIITGADAKQFRQNVGGALMLRLERLRVTITAYQIAKNKSLQLKQMIHAAID
ncbi:MAG: hypothetical protein ACK4IY_03910 [Chitinophagales bacterium]